MSGSKLQVTVWSKLRWHASSAAFRAVAIAAAGAVTVGAAWNPAVNAWSNVSSPPAPPATVTAVPPSESTSPPNATVFVLCTAKVKQLTVRSLDAETVQVNGARAVPSTAEHGLHFWSGEATDQFVITIIGDVYAAATPTDESTATCAQVNEFPTPNPSVTPTGAPTTSPTSKPSPEPVTTSRTIEATVVLPFRTVYVKDSDLAKGKTRTLRAGREGSRTDTYKVTYVDGKEAKRVRISSTVTLEPVSRKVARGTKSSSTPKPASPKNVTTSDSFTCSGAATITVTATGGGTVTVTVTGPASGTNSGKGSASVQVSADNGGTYRMSASAASKVNLDYQWSGRC